MGGNVTAINKTTGEETRAEKIPIKKIGRNEFTTKFIKVFKEINKIFKKENGIALWLDEKNLENGLQFNGSTSYIFDQTISDKEITDVKESAGDLDIIVPEGLKNEVWKMLDGLEGKTIIPGVKYMGSNKPTVASIGEQINSVFLVDFDGTSVPSQVDFEFLPMEKDGSTPTEWAKFSHSSSFEDAKAGVKAVHHKYLIQSLVGGASIRDDVVIVTKSATIDNYTKKIKKSDGTLPRMLKFSVGRGIGKAYELMHDLDGNVLQIDGKDVYRERKPAERTYETTVKEIFKLSFGRLEDHPGDVQKFNSFVGVLELMKKYLNKKQIEATHKRYVEKLWGMRSSTKKVGHDVSVGQSLERGDPEADYAVKISGYNRFIKTFGLKPDKKAIDRYYKSFEQKDVAESLIRTAIERSNLDEL